MLSTALVMCASMVVGQAGDVNIPKEVLAEFEFLLGDWTYTGDSDQGPVKGTLSAKWVPGKHAIRYEMTWTDPNHTSKGTGLDGWDAARKKIASLEFWSDGWGHFRRYTIESPGVWVSDDWQGVNDKGQPLTGRATLRQDGPNKLLWKSENLTVAGEKTKDTEITFIRNAKSID